MEITLTVNGKPVKATVDEKEMREAMKEKKKTGYEICWDGYFINREGEVEPIYSQSISACEESDIYKAGNYYSNKKVAENNARADALMRKLRRFAAEHGGCVAPKRVPKLRIGTAYRIIYTRGKLLAIGIDTKDAMVSGIVFSTREGAESAIKALQNDLLWYFTEYDPMPEGWWEN